VFLAEAMFMVALSLPLWVTVLFSLLLAGGVPSLPATGLISCLGLLAQSGFPGSRQAGPGAFGGDSGEPALADASGMVTVEGTAVNICSGPVDAVCLDVEVAPFRMDLTETTAEQFSAWLKSGLEHEGKWRTFKDSDFCNLEAPGRERHPMNCLNQIAARAYCRAQGKRLPTRAEWMAAAGAADGRKYAWGDASPDCTVADFHGDEGRGCGKGTTVAVTALPAGRSPLGFFHMSGNVMEWTSTIARPPDDAGKAQVPDEENPRTKFYLMGGAFADSANTLELGYSCYDGAKDWTVSAGLRCAADAK